MKNLHVVLVSETPDIKTGELYELAKALRLNGQHCAEAWGHAPPAVDVIDKLGKIPPGAHPILFIDSTSEKFLAHHYHDPLRNGPAARVFVPMATGMNRGRGSVAEAASHELVEMMVDPAVNLWVDMPGDPGIQVALENADPVQTHYKARVCGTDWFVSNFVTPFWFNGDLFNPEKAAEFRRRGGKFDHSGELQFAGEIGPEGYAILRIRDERGHKTYTINRRKQRQEFTNADAKWHPLSRTRIRGVEIDNA